MGSVPARVLLLKGHINIHNAKHQRYTNGHAQRQGNSVYLYSTPWRIVKVHRATPWWVSTRPFHAVDGVYMSPLDPMRALLALIALVSALVGLVPHVNGQQYLYSWRPSVVADPLVTSDGRPPFISSVSNVDDAPFQVWLGRQGEGGREGKGREGRMRGAPANVSLGRFVGLRMPTANSLAENPASICVSVLWCSPQSGFHQVKGRYVCMTVGWFFETTQKFEQVMVDCRVLSFLFWSLCDGLQSQRRPPFQPKRTVLCPERRVSPLCVFDSHGVQNVL